MNENYLNIDNGASYESREDNNPLGNIDIDKILSVLKKSLPWIILIMAITNTLAYLYIRWTPEVYESVSELKLEIKNEASLFGFNNFPEQQNQNINTISGEIELIRSKLFFDKVIGLLDLDINYYFYGNILVNERYKRSPFRVDYNLKNTLILDKKFDLEIIDKENFNLIYFLGNEEINESYRFGEKIETEHFIFTIHLTQYFIGNESEGKYYFTINSDRALISYLSENLTVEPLNLNANTIKIAFKDNNKLKARDLVNAIDTIYLNYTQEQKNIANRRKIDFLNQQIEATIKKLESFEDYFESFTIDNKTTNVQGDMDRIIEFINAVDSQRFVLEQRRDRITNLQQYILADSLIKISQLPILEIPEELKNNIDELNQLIVDNQLLLSSYKQKTQAYRIKKQRIDFLKGEITNMMEVYRKNYNDELNSLYTRKLELLKNFESLPSKGTEFNKNKRAFDLEEQVYLSLQQKKTEFEIAEAGTKPDFVILSSASLPHEPIYPNTLLVYAIGAVAGFILSLLFIGIKYLLHNKVTSQIELERISLAPILGAIPYHKDADLHLSNLVIDKNPKSGITEAFRLK